MNFIRIKIHNLLSENQLNYAGTADKDPSMYDKVRVGKQCNSVRAFMNGKGQKQNGKYYVYVIFCNKKSNYFRCELTRESCFNSFKQQIKKKLDLIRQRVMSNYFIRLSHYFIRLSHRETG